MKTINDIIHIDSLASTSSGIHRRQTTRGSSDLRFNMKRYLSGEAGKILTTTDARGIELEGIGRKPGQEPEAGNTTLSTSLDISIYRSIVQQACNRK